MTDADQIYIFLVCVACGCVGGVLYDILYCALYLFRSRWVKIVRDVFFFLVFSALFLYVSVLFGLPDFRLYSFLGCLGGLFLYLKSFHKIVAFFAEKLYNGIKRLRKDKRPCRERETSTPKKGRRRQKELP